MTRKAQFLAKLVKALEKGYSSKRVAKVITKMEILADDLFEKALDSVLAKREELKKKEEKKE
jgi:hypothetical protein